MYCYMYWYKVVATNFCSLLLIKIQDDCLIWSALGIVI